MLYSACFNEQVLLFHFNAQLKLKVQRYVNRPALGELDERIDSYHFLGDLINI